MNNKAKFTALGLVSLFTFTVACGVAILSNNSTFEPLIADGEDPEEKEVTLEAAELSAVSFSDHDFGRAKQETNNKGDQEFRINLANGNYIDGALIFSDCGHCNIGNTLGDVFQLDNSLQDSGNSFNFNFFFNVRGIKQATIYYTSTITGEPFVVSNFVRIRLRAAALDTDFYSALAHNYDTYKQDSNAIYPNTTDISYSNSDIWEGDCTMPLTTSFTKDLLNFHINGDAVPAGRIVSLQITKIVLKYDCAM